MKINKELKNRVFIHPVTGAKYVVEDVQDNKVILSKCSDFVSVDDLLTNWKEVNESDSYLING